MGTILQSLVQGILIGVVLLGIYILYEKYAKKK